MCTQHLEVFFFLIIPSKIRFLSLWRTKKNHNDTYLEKYGTWYMTGVFSMDINLWIRSEEWDAGCHISEAKSPLPTDLTFVANSIWTFSARLNSSSKWNESNPYLSPNTSTSIWIRSITSSFCFVEGLPEHDFSSPTCG